METAARNGVRTLALTDHDTTEGLGEAMEAAARLGLRLVPGIELSTDYGKADVHLLAYGFDREAPRLQEFLRWLRGARRGRAERIVAILAELGAPIELSRVLAIAGEAAIGRPHIARALVEAGHAASVQDAFDRYVGNGGPADVPREKLTPQQAVNEVHAAGGVVLAAHPTFIGEAYEEAIRAFAALGLDGIETYYKHYAPETVERHRALGEELGLAHSGGSDYHGIGNPDDREIGDIAFPAERVAAFVAFLASRCFDAGAGRQL